MCRLNGTDEDKIDNSEELDILHGRKICWSVNESSCDSSAKITEKIDLIASMSQVDPADQS